MAVVDDALRFCSTLEAEVLVELMLRFWTHPLAADADFRNDLLEKSTVALEMAKAGDRLLEDIPSLETNFVAAVWYVERMATASFSEETSEGERRSRLEWLEKVRRALPSCFVDQGDLI